MSARRARKEAAPKLPDLLLRVIHAARHAPYDPADRAGHDTVLRDLGRWALVYVPSRGVLAPSEDHAYKAIQEIATRHLEYGKARAAWRKALLAIEPFERRSEVESAQNWLQSESDDAYYYAGLACGITLADMATIRFDSGRQAAWFEGDPEKP
jgi:hypothetical protein